MLRFCTALGLALCLVSGCSGYREVAQPWGPRIEGTEFMTARGIEPGDRLRVVERGGRVATGRCLVVSDLSLTVADANTGTATIPFDSVVEIEVYEHLPWQTAALVATTALGSLLLYAVLHEPRVHDPFAARSQGRIGSD